jgi:hypothetical protein
LFVTNKTAWLKLMAIDSLRLLVVQRAHHEAAVMQSLQCEFNSPAILDIWMQAITKLLTVSGPDLALTWTYKPLNTKKLWPCKDSYESFLQITKTPEESLPK